VAGDSVEVWNGFDTEVVNAERFMLRVRGEIRSSNAFRDFLSARGIVEARVPVARHFHVLGQYQAVQAHPEEFDWEGHNRATGGIELPFEREKITVTVRAAGEHFWFRGERDYQRHRERVQVRFTQLRFQPLVGMEIMADAEG
jgi:hypothetical protein